MSDSVICCFERLRYYNFQICLQAEKQWKLFRFATPGIRCHASGTRRKPAPSQSAMSMPVFRINRAGGSLDAGLRRIPEQTGKELRIRYRKK